MQRAVELFERSEDLYNDGEFREAARLIEEAYELAPDPVLLFNLGRALESAGDLDGAIEAYARYLDEAPSAEDRGAIEVRLRTLRNQRDRLAQGGDEDGDRYTTFEEPADGEVDGEGGGSALPWVVAGAGVAVTGLGVAFGLMSQSKHDSAESARVQRDAFDLQSDAETFATLANVSLAVGIVAIVGGVVLWLLED